jgi:flavodoxin
LTARIAHGRLARMDVLIVYEGQRGSTQRVAEALQQAVALHRHVGTLAILEDTTPAAVAAADAVLLGCWSEGDEAFGSAATKHLVDWIEALPDLAGKPIGVYCAVSALPHPFSHSEDTAETTIAALCQGVADGNGAVAATHVFNRFGLDPEAAAFVEAVFAAVE